MELYEKFLGIIKNLQDKGVPILVIRDPLTKLPSVSLTLMVIAFFFVSFSVINSYFGWLKIPTDDGAMELFLVTAGLYFGRSLSKKIQPDK